MKNNDTIYIKDQLLQIVELLIEIKEILKSEKDKKDNQLPRKI
jgi:hypothetical protein